MKVSIRHRIPIVSWGLAATFLCGFGQISYSQGSQLQSTQLQRVAKVILSPGNASLYSAVIDPANGRAYFMTSGSVSPATFIAVALGAGNAPPTEIGWLTLPNGNYGLIGSGIDTINGYAYVSNVSSNPGVITKIQLGTGNTAPSLVGTLTLNSGPPLPERGLFACAVDGVRGYGYVTAGPKIVKFALGAGNAATRIGAVSLTACFRLLLDPSTGYLYGVTSGSNSVVYKIDPGVGNNPPSLVGSVTFLPGEFNFSFAALDSATGYGFLGTYPLMPDGSGQGTLVKFALGAGSAAPTRIGSVTTSLHYFSAGGIDPVTHYVYVGNDNSFPTSSILQFHPGQGNAPPSLIATIALQPGTQSYTFATRPTPADPVLAGEIYIQSCVIDPAGYAYFGTDTHSGQVIKVQLAGH